MSEPQKIAVINVAWSDDYQGSDVIGQHGYILDGGEGHEKYNLLPAPDGRYYLYVPPVGGRHVAPAESKDWLIFMVSKKPKQPGLVVIAWFERARFDKDWPLRPDWAELKKDEGIEYHYSVVAEEAFVVPEPARDFTFRGDHVKRPLAYLRGVYSEPWREELAELLLNYRTELIHSASNGANSQNTHSIAGYCLDPARRKQIEEAAIAAVKQHFGEKYIFRDRQNCRGVGYDLEFTHRSTSETICVEVKGTEMPEPHFIISANEYRIGKHMSEAGEASGTRWTMAVVCDALTSPKIKFYDFEDMIEHFQLRALSWHATPRPKRMEA